MNVIFDTRLQLDVPKICTTFNQLNRCLTRIVKNQDHFGWVSKHDRDAAFFAFVEPDVVEELAVALGVKAENSPSIDSEEKCLEHFRVDVSTWLYLTDLRFVSWPSILEEGSSFWNEFERCEAWSSALCSADHCQQTQVQACRSRQCQQKTELGLVQDWACWPKV